MKFTKTEQEEVKKQLAAIGAIMYKTIDESKSHEEAWHKALGRVMERFENLDIHTAAYLMRVSMSCITGKLHPAFEK